MWYTTYVPTNRQICTEVIVLMLMVSITQNHGKMTAVSIVEYDLATDSKAPATIEGEPFPTVYVADTKQALPLGAKLLALLNSYNS